MLLHIQTIFLGERTFERIGPCLLSDLEAFSVPSDVQHDGHSIERKLERTVVFVD